MRNEQADDARHQEDDLHRVSVLAQECLPARLFLFFGKLVEAEALAALRRLFGAQAAIGIDVLRLERVPRAHGVERRLLRGGPFCRCFCDGHAQRPPAFLLAFFVFPERFFVGLSASSSRRAVSSDAFASALTVGYCGSMSARTFPMAAAATRRENHLLSAGTTYQGAHLVLVLLSTSENAAW